MSKQFWVAGMLPFAAIAQQPSSVTADETMVVTASRFEQSASSVLAPVTVVTREDIDAMQAKSLVDVLKRMPSIEVGQSGGRGQQASIFMRGTESNHTLVLVDGVRLPRSIMGTIDFNMLPLNSIQRVELIRGAGATTYGSDAIGGVLNIITVSDVSGASLSIEAGSRNYSNTNAGFTEQVSDTVVLQAQAGYEKTDGYNVFPTPGNEGEKHGFEGRNASLRIGFTPNAFWKTNLTGRWFENEAGYDSWGTKKFGFVDSQSIGVDGLYSNGIFRTKFMLNTSSQKNYDFALGEKVGASNLTSDLRLSTASLASTVQAHESLLLNGGIEMQHEEYRGGNAVDKELIKDNPRSNLAIYSGATWQASDVAVFEASLRHDSNDQFGSNNTYNFAAGLALAEGFDVTLSYGRAFKAPSFNELYGWGGNTDLKPEESEKIEAGFSGYLGPIDYQVSVYRQDIDNLIVYEWSTEKMMNVAEATISGVEFVADFAVGDLDNTLVLEYRDPRDKLKNEILARRAKTVAKWNASYYLGDVLLGSSLLYQSERLDYSGGDMLASYAVWDFTAQYSVTESLMVKAKVANAFDKEYETAGGYPAPERSYFASLNYQF